jgi:phage baseplate assembly protein W
MYTKGAKMSISRADQITQTQKKLETYSDFHNNMARHPVTNQLVILRNEDAVRQAFKNLVYTNVFSRFFNPFFGTNIRKSMFELDTPFLIEDIRSAIVLSARQFEPRINIVNVTIMDSPDQNGFAVNIVFNLVNSQNLITLPIILKRAR